MSRIPLASSNQPATWTTSPFIRHLLPHLFVEEEMNGRPSEHAILTALFEIALVIAPIALSHSFGSGPTVEELVSDVVDLFISGFEAPRFDPKGDAEEYLGGIMRTLALAYDQKHRRRRVGSLDTADLIVDSRAAQPWESASRREVTSIAMNLWPMLTPRRRDAIRAQLGPVFVSEESFVDDYSKNYMAKHHGLRQFKRLFAMLGISEM